MSNYTTKRRSGGGVLTFATAAKMVRVQHAGLNSLLVSFDRPVLIALADETQFETAPSLIIGDSLLQTSPAQWTVLFADDVSTETDLAFTGNSQFFVSPQVIGIF